MTPVGVFFCWQGGAERDFVNSAIVSQGGVRHEGSIVWVLPSCVSPRYAGGVSYF